MTSSLEIEIKVTKSMLEKTRKEALESKYLSENARGNYRDEMEYWSWYKVLDERASVLETELRQLEAKLKQEMGAA